MRSFGGLLLMLVAGRAFAQTPPTDPGPPGSEQPSPGPPDSTPPPPPPTTTAPPPTTTAPPPVTPPPPSSDVKLWIGPQLDIMPIGRIHRNVAGVDASTDASMAFGLGGLLDYRVHPYFTIGVAPRFVVPVKEDEAEESASAFDLRFRGTAGKDVSSTVRLHGIITLGYSWIFDLYEDTAGMGHTSSGFIFGIGGGIHYAIRPRVLLVGELSYQFGYQRTTITAIKVEADASYLTFGFGVVFPMM